MWPTRFRLTVVMLSTTALSCDCGAPVRRSTGAVRAEPTVVDFGLVPARRVVTRLVRVSNRGEASARLSNATVTDSRGAFARGAVPQGLEPGEETMVELSYRAPVVSGADVGLLSIETDGDGQVEVTLRGTSVMDADDAGPGSGEDGGADAGAALAVDAGTDAGTDAGADPTDAGPDAGGPGDAGAPSCPSAMTQRDVGQYPAALASLAWTGVGYVAAVDHRIQPATGLFEVFLETTDATGQPLKPAVQVSPNDGKSSFWPRVAFSGAEYGLVFIDEDAPYRAVFMRADAALAPISGSLVPLGSPTSSQTRAAIAWGHGNWAVSWSEIAAGGQQTFFQRFSAAGVPLAPAQVLGGGAVARAGTTLVSTTSGWAILALGSTATIYEVGLSGTVRVIALPFGGVDGAIAFDGSQYAVVAADALAVGTRFARIQAGGGLISGSTATLGPNSQIPNVEWNGAAFIVTWSVTTASNPQPLQWALVSPSSTASSITGSSLTVLGNAGFHHIVAGSCGWAVLYQTFTADSLDRLEVRP